MPVENQVAPSVDVDKAACNEPNLADTLNKRYQGLSNDAIKSIQRRIVYIWSLTQLFGSFAMPAWIAVFATQWYTAVNLVPGEVALVVTFSKCIDVMTDPMMACYLRGCTMRKIAVIAVIGAAIQGIAFVGLFVPFKPIDPDGGRGRVLGQYAFFYVLFFIGDTLTGTPVTTLGNMLKSQKILDEDHHNDGLRVGSMMKVVGIMSMGLITFICKLIVDSTSGDMGPEDGVQSGLYPWTNLWTAVVCSLLHILINAWLYVALLPYGDSTISAEVKVLLSTMGFLQQFSSMMASSFNNVFFRQLIFAWMCDQLTITLMKNLLMWFVRHRVEPEMAQGCEAYEDPVNTCAREMEGFESGLAKKEFECKASNAAVVAVFFLIMGAIVGNVFWQKKIESERDRFGNRNMYHNWLMFNLSSAVTNGLMVFVGRGDVRLFWILCFINGLPAGGEFMTDTILLFLIGSEVYSTRSDVALTPAGEAEQLDSHTTKFAMMKTFIPKAVSLVAEALPLALIQIWYRDPTSICKEADPPLDTSSTECANFLVYNGTGNPKHIPQEPQVGELIGFFFFVLPTMTCLVSYYIKSKFQVTDSGELVMLGQTRRGVPAVDERKGLMVHNAERAINVESDEGLGDDPGKEAPDVDMSEECITLMQKRELQKSLKEVLERLDAAEDEYGTNNRPGSSQAAAREGAQASSAQADEAVQEANDVLPLSRATLDGYMQHMQHVYEAPAKYDEKTAKKADAGGLALSNVQHPKFQEDEWVGTIVPTTNEQHLFKLPYYYHPLSVVPLSILQWATDDDDDRITMSSFRLTHEDGEGAASVKGVLHGLLLPAYIALKIVWKILSVVVYSTIYFLKHLKPGVRPEIPMVQLSKIQLFGVLGRTSVVSFGESLAPILASHILHPGDPAEVPKTKAQVLGWLSEARSKQELRGLNRKARSRMSCALGMRDWRLISGREEHTAKVAFSGDPIPVEARCMVRVAYLRAGGIAFFVLMSVTVAVIFGVAGFDIVSGPWSIAVTVPLFLAAMGLVLFFFCQGLMGLGTPTGENPPEIDRARMLDANGLAALGALHYNTYNTAGGKPLIYFSSDMPTDLLNGVNRNIRLVQEGEEVTGPKDAVLSYMVFVPAQAVHTAVRMLVPVHETFDRVEQAANEQRARDGLAANIKWSVASIALADEYPQYRCFLYCWDGVEPPTRKKKIL
eukprot:TRINITY_DN13367_c0_g1_i1.p1 TRINITY_DN13367_c0_g1~~TRINITY_DN13367_c0_g1_i1.p1  ORF type:complete len:1193 (+),score=455.51 TRINITY_DN13367_c0_g1_i1:117-3695(+)